MKKFGILCPLFSIPSPYGIGTPGKAAYDFVDALNQMGAKYWQVLPLCPVGQGHSPYASSSAFASDPSYIDLDLLAEQGLLFLNELTYEAPDRVVYDCPKRRELLHLAYTRAVSKGLNGDYADWMRQNGEWAQPYAEYQILVSRYGARADFPTWALTRDGDAYQNFLDTVAEEMQYLLWQQYVFDDQWKRLKAYCNRLGISVIGDLPIYVADESCEVWSEPQNFLVKDGQKEKVAGVPPDYFSSEGQLWGNPLYDWTAMEQDGYAWWIRRMRRALSLYDVVRLDHFRGFSAYYAVDADAKDARNGQWFDGPKMKLFDAMEHALGKLPVIAEDLGTLDDGVHRLLAETGFPGMKVVQFAFDGNPNNPYLPRKHIKNCVVYTGTHDNLPLCGWVAQLDDQARAIVRRMLGCDEDLVRAVTEAALSGGAATVIFPIQDLLGLGEESRMNVPGSVNDRNWSWRLSQPLSEETVTLWSKRLQAYGF